MKAICIFLFIILSGCVAWGLDIHDRKRNKKRKEPFES